jgi:DNA-binding Lrp family transcriptional regulator
MPISKEIREYVKSELPYQLLQALYKDSRTPLKPFGEKHKLSYHRVATALAELEKSYNLAYTLEIDYRKLGFSEGTIVSAKFENMPDVELLKERLKKDIFVQNGYLANGDFNLLLVLVGLSPLEVGAWQFKFRMDFAEYKPKVTLSTAYAPFIGFFPIRNEIIEKCEVLNPVERRVLALLNSNSRIRIEELIKSAKTTRMKALYIIKKLKALGIIKRFGALTQNPDKRILAAYLTTFTPVSAHAKLRSKFREEVLKEDFHEGISDYAIGMDTIGAYDALYICAFENGTVQTRRSPDILKNLWAVENPKIETAALTDILIGKWPFHLERYEALVEMERQIKGRGESY